MRLSNLAAQRFADALTEQDIGFTPTKDVDRELSASVVLKRSIGDSKTIWIGLGGYKDSDRVFCLRGAWTRLGQTFKQVSGLEVMPADESSWVVDLRHCADLSPEQTGLRNHELMLDPVPENVSLRWAERYCNLPAGVEELKSLQAYESKLKNRRAPEEVERSFRIAKAAWANTWDGLVKVSGATDAEVSNWVAPIVDEALVIVSQFGVEYLVRQVSR